MCFKKSHQIVNNSIYIDSNVYKLRNLFFFVLQKVILETFAYVFYKNLAVCVFIIVNLSIAFFYSNFVTCIYQNIAHRSRCPS